MKLLNPIRLSVGLAALFVAQGSWAAGTLAGTDVSNTATLTYSVGSTTQAPVTSNTTVFEVDRKIDLNVTGAALSAPVIANPSETGVTLTYTLTNEGNSTQNFAVDVSHIGNVANVDQFNAGEGTETAPTPQTDCTVNITGVTPDGVIGQATPMYVEDLAPDGTATITVTCVMPNKPDVVDGDVSVIDVSATALEPTTDQGLFTTAPTANAALVNSTGADVEDEVDTVFADAAGITGTQTTDTAVENATHSATHSYEIASPELTVVKSSEVVADPVTCGDVDANGNYSAVTNALTDSCADAKRIPGAVIEYTITLANDSDTVPKGVSISDTLQSDVTFVPGSVKIGPSVAGSPPAVPAPATSTSTDFTYSDPYLTFGIVNDNATPADPSDDTGGITVPANGYIPVTFRVTVN